MPLMLNPAVAVLEAVLGFLRAWGPGVLVLGLLVLVHELGHFFAAKALKVPVHRFSIGFGPRLFGFRRGETEYQVAAIPLGGYNSMAEEIKGEDGEPRIIDHFGTQHWFVRAVIALAGPAANLVTGYFAMLAVGLVGVTYDDYRPVVGPLPETSAAAAVGFAPEQRVLAVDGEAIETWRGFAESVTAAEGDARVTVAAADGAERDIVVPRATRDSVLISLGPAIPAQVGHLAVGYPAYSAGLREGDVIEAIDGQPVRYWDDLTAVIHGSAGREIELAVRRGDNRFEAKVKPVAQDLGGQTLGVIGITPPRDGSYVVRPSPGQAVLGAFPMTANLVTQTGRGLWMLVARPQQAKDQVGGPLMIMRMSSEQARRGTADLLFLMGVISIAIMAFNLLPLPILDGGHVLLAFLEGVRRRPLAQGFLTAYQRLGLALIGLLLVFIIFNDVWREAQRGRAVSRGDRVESGPAEAP